MLSADWSLTDRSTWATLLAVVAAVLSDIFHRSFAAYVPAAATIAAGLVVAALAIAKHHYAAAVASAASTIPAAQTEAPALPQPVTDALNAARTALEDVSNLVAAPRAPQRTPAAPATAPQAAPVASSPVLPVSAAPAAT